MPRIPPALLCAQVHGRRSLSTLGPLQPSLPLGARVGSSWSRGVRVRRQVHVDDAQLNDFLSKAETELLVTSTASPDVQEPRKGHKGKHHHNARTSAAERPDSHASSSRIPAPARAIPAHAPDHQAPAHALDHQASPASHSRAAADPARITDHDTAATPRSLKGPRSHVQDLFIHPPNRGGTSAAADQQSSAPSLGEAATDPNVPSPTRSRPPGQIVPRALRKHQRRSRSLLAAEGSAPQIPSEDPRLRHQLRPPVLRLAKGMTVGVHVGFISCQHTTKSGMVTFSRLREACTCHLCVDPSTRQRTHTPGAAHAAASQGQPKVTSAGVHLQVTWGDGHQSRYSEELLQGLSSGFDSWQVRYKSPVPRRLWKNEQALQSQSLALQTQYSDLFPGGRKEADERQLFDVLHQLQVLGIAIIKGVPTAPTENADCELRRVAEAISPIRSTFYGETWNVQSMKDSKNVAYTKVDLGPHMDLLYFENPPRFQLLHCLRNRVSGGESYFIDAFNVSEELRVQQPAVFKFLRTLSLTYEYDNDGHKYRHMHSVFPLQPFHVPNAAINWSPPFLGASSRSNAGLPGLLYELQAYDAQQAFEKELAKPENQYQFLLEEGDLVLFDNRRILHARREFKDWTRKELEAQNVQIIPGEPTRWLKGCYLDGDAVWDKLQVLGQKYAPMPTRTSAPKGLPKGTRPVIDYSDLVEPKGNATQPA